MSGVLPGVFHDLWLTWLAVLFVVCAASVSFGYWLPRIEHRRRHPARAGVRAGRRRAGCRRRGELPAGYQLDLGRMPAGTVLRRVHDRPAGLAATEAPAPSLVADYWLERPDGRGLVQLAFATPMVGLRQSLLELFDAIAGALRWVSERPDRPVPSDSRRS